MRYFYLILLVIVLAVALDHFSVADTVMSYIPSKGQEFKVNKNVANGYAGLDENGKVSASAIETITIVFAGGQATDRSL